MTQWVSGWQKKGWKKSDGKPVLNKGDFQALMKHSEGIKINWVSGIACTSCVW